MFDKKVDAQRWVDGQSASLVVGTHVDPAAGKVTVGELGPAWVQRQTHLKPSAYRPIETAWRVHVEPKWGSRPIDKVVHSAVQQWVADLAAGPVVDEETGARKPRSATLVIRAHGVLASILEDAVKDKRLASNPARGVKLPRKRKKRHVYLTHDQLHQLAKTAGDGRSTCVLVLGYTGMRWGEMAALRVRDCDLLRRRITITENAVALGAHIHVGTPKSHRKRTVPLPSFLVELVAKQCEGRGRDDLLFPAPEGGGYMRPPNSKRGWFDSALKRAGLERMTPHDLRHTAASLAVSAGANVKAVQKMLGHASAAMTLDVYADLFDDDLEAVAERLDAAVVSAGLRVAR